MRDPVRWGDARSTGPRSLRRLIRAARADTPDADRLRGLADRLGFGPDPSAGSAGLAAKGAATVVGWASGGKLGVAIALVLGMGAAAGAWSARGTSAPVGAVPAAAESLPWQRSEPAAPPQPGDDPTAAETSPRGAPSAMASPIASAIASPIPSPAAPPSKVRAQASPPRAPGTARLAPPRPAVSATASAARETAATEIGTMTPTATAEPPVETEPGLLEQARRALHVDPARALALADRHELRYPSGALVPDREAIAIEALVGLGRLDEARARAGHFFRAFPGSVHQRHVEALLGVDRGVDNP
jgi:hypothetical protein